MKKTIATKPGEPSLHVDLTPSEVAKRQAEEAKVRVPSKRSLLEETESFETLSGVLEDILEALKNGGDLPTKTLDWLDTRKNIKGTD